MSRRILAVVASAVVLGGVYILARRNVAEPSSASSAASPHAKPPAPANSTTPPSAAHESAAASASGPSRSAPRNDSPAAILARLTALKVNAGQPRSIRELIVELEKLRELGVAALPTVREFLASGQDADYDSALGKMGFHDGKVPLDFAAPPSLRLGLLELAKNIGGAAAEDLLARELKTTGRGVEAGYIAAALEQMAPGKYGATAVAAARDLLALPFSTTPKNLLDRADREFLYQILASAGDGSQVAQAQAQLLLPNGQIDRGALRYLQAALGPAALDVTARAWNDPRVPDKQREPLARVALNWAGADDRADQFYEVAIHDPKLSPEARKNLVEDLNQDGFVNAKKPTPADLVLVDRRLALIDRLAPGSQDPILVAAFAEAKKDLLAMRAKARQASMPTK